MGKYNGAVITAAGQNLIAQAIAESKTVTFTTAQASSHAYPSSTDFEALTALTDVEKTVDINYAGVYSDTVVQVSARFDNDGVDTAYLINTLGFFAQLGTDTPILFAVSTAVTPDQMPVFDADNPSAFIYNMQITVQNANSINVSVNPAGTVTVDQLNTVVSIINAKIGDLSDLTTADKTSLVNAVNEVDNHTDIVQAQVSNSDDAYDPTRPYKIGELCIYNNKLYRCITACSAGSWEVNQSCFTEDTLTNVLSKMNLDIELLIPKTALTTAGIIINIPNLDNYKELYFYTIGDSDNMSFGQTIIPTKLVKTFNYGFMTAASASGSFSFLTKIKYQGNNSFLISYNALQGFSTPYIVIYGIH